MAKKRIIWLVLLVILFLNIVFFIHTRVDNGITAEDILYIQKILTEGGNVRPLSPNRSYQEEIDFIRTVQNAVLAIIAKGECLPKGTSREPKYVYLARCGESYDKSKVIEKILRNFSFKTRHIMIFSAEHTGSKVKSLLSKEAFSHSVTEVLTSKGWLVLDPDDHWLSLDDRGQPVSIARIQSDTDVSLISWDQAGLTKMPLVYQHPFTFVYGLYSRHGKFYPSYNFIPDINWREFAYNLMVNF